MPVGTEVVVKSILYFNRHFTVIPIIENTAVDIPGYNSLYGDYHLNTIFKPIDF